MAEQMRDKIYFSHGQESGPWGTKIQRLSRTASDLGCEFASIDYRGMTDPQARVDKLVATVRDDDVKNYILVGSSMGAYVSIAASHALSPRGLFLLAAAVMLPAYPESERLPACGHVEMVHGWNDEIIPADLAIEYARRADCSLHLVSGEHRLQDAALDATERLFRAFLIRMRDTP